MASSLVLGTFDLLDPSSPVFLSTGFDRGAPAPTVSEIQSTILDGAVVTGRASGNRKITIPVVVRAADRVSVAQYTNTLLAAVDQASWTLTFTPDGGYPVVYDCFRGAAVITSDLIQDGQLLQEVTVTCEALPYGRSPSSVTVPLSGSPLTVDAFDTGPGPGFTASTGAVGSPTYVTTPTPAQGTACLDVPFTHASIPSGDLNTYSIDLTIARTGLSITPTTDMASFTVYMRPDGSSTYTWDLTLRVNASSGNSTVTISAPLSPGYWRQVTFNLTSVIPSGATITAWYLEAATSRVGNWTGGPSNLYFDYLAAFPASSSGVADTQGATVHLNNVQGTARTPVALALTQSAAGSFHSWCVYSAPADTPSAQPLIPLNGATSYTTDATVRYHGTYDVWAAIDCTVSGPSRVLTVTFSQSLGAAGSVSVSAATAVGVGKWLIHIGTVSLPLTAYADEASATTTVSASSGGGDTFLDVLLLDTRGQTIMVDQSAASKSNVWVDAPTPTAALGGVWSGNNADRSDAASVGGALVRAGSLLANPGDSTLLLYSVEGVLAGTATYFPRWLQEATA